LCIDMIPLFDVFDKLGSRLLLGDFHNKIIYKFLIYYCDW
jgi:hypothetical protein